MGKLFNRSEKQPIRIPPASETEKPTIGEQVAAAADPAVRAKKRKIILISICTAAVILLACAITAIWYFYGWPTNNGLILDNVVAGGIDLGGMTTAEAKAALHNMTDHTYTETDMVVELPDTSMHFSPVDTGVKLDVDAIVSAAHAYGRIGSLQEREAAKEALLTTAYEIPFLSYLNLNLDYIKGQLDAYGASYNSVYEPSSVTFDVDAPVLDTGDENFKEDAPCQVMTLTIGAPGRNLDIEKVYNQVLDAYNANTFLVKTQLEEPETLPEPLDVNALYEQYRKEPADAELDKTTCEVSHEVYGYSFDLEKALEQMETATYGDTIEIPFRYLLPEIHKADLDCILFRDVLGEYETAHSGNRARTTNIRLACEAINGLVLDVGETFDFNGVVGERTAAKGYMEADAYSDGLTVSARGGGICQVSSTLYYCTLVADLKIVDRSPHSYVSSYMPIGMDATVSWGGPHFKFQNNTNYPIRIEAKEEEGYVRIKLIGTDEKDYYIKMEYEIVGSQSPGVSYREFSSDNPQGYTDGQVIATPYTGYTAKTYKVKYSKETDEMISRDFDRTSQYKKRDEIIAVIVD